MARLDGERMDYYWWNHSRLQDAQRGKGRRKCEVEIEGPGPATDAVDLDAMDCSVWKGGRVTDRTFEPVSLGIRRKRVDGVELEQSSTSECG